MKHSKQSERDREKERERNKDHEREKSMCMEYLGLVLTFELSSELSHVSLPACISASIGFEPVEEEKK